MERRYLIDSNAAIDFLGNKFTAKGMAFMNEVVDATPNLSIITKIEILGFALPEEHERTINAFISDSTVFPLTDEIADLCITLRRRAKIKLPDAIIAVTALGQKLTLITRNVSDFRSIDGLDVVNPHEI